MGAVTAGAEDTTQEEVAEKAKERATSVELATTTPAKWVKAVEDKVTKKLERQLEEESAVAEGEEQHEENEPWFPNAAATAVQSMVRGRAARKSIEKDRQLEAEPAVSATSISPKLTLSKSERKERL